MVVRWEGRGKGLGQKRDGMRSRTPVAIPYGSCTVAYKGGILGYVPWTSLDLKMAKAFSGSWALVEAPSFLFAFRAPVQDLMVLFAGRCCLRIERSLVVGMGTGWAPLATALILR